MLRFLLTVCLLVSFTSLAQQSSPIRVISVSGMGSIAGVPDMLSFTVYLEEKGKLATKLNELIDAKSTQITDFLRQRGVEDKDIQSMRVNLRPFYRRTPEGQIQDGYVFSRAINISLRNIQAYPQILDGILKYGANRIDGFSYQIENQQTLYLQALELATQNALLRANKLAGSLGVKVVEVLSVQEISNYHPGLKQQGRMMVAESGQSYSPGTITISANVKIECSLGE